MGQKQAILFQVAACDNVATALVDLQPGKARIVGEAKREAVVAEKIPKGHKMAIAEIREGEAVVKYGIAIGRATKEIRIGQWVHLHNMESIYDHRGAALDALTGIPKDMSYE